MSERSEIKPMVCGLFPRAEHDVVLAMLAKSVVFLTPENIETVLLEESFNHSAWTLAILYLAGLGAELLSQPLWRVLVPWRPTWLASRAFPSLLSAWSRGRVRPAGYLGRELRAP